MLSSTRHIGATNSAVARLSKEATVCSRRLAYTPTGLVIQSLRIQAAPPESASRTIRTNPLPATCYTGQICRGRATLSAVVGYRKEGAGSGAPCRGIIAQRLGGVVGLAGDDFSSQEICLGNG